MTDREMRIGPAGRGLLAAVMEQSVDGLVVVDAEGIVRLANPAAEAMFSGTVEQLVGHHLGLPSITEPVELVLPGGEQPRYVEMRSREFQWQGHGGSLASLRDITDRKRAEQALRDSEERFRTIMASMQDIVFTLDTEQRHTGVFGPWVAQMGLTPEHFVGRTSREILGDESAPLHEDANARALKGEFVVYEWSVPGPDGVLHYQTSLSPWKDENGVVRGIVGVGRDITERKQSEDALRDRERYLNAILETTLDGFWVLDSEGRIVRVNEAYSRMSGYTKDELLRLRIADLEVDETPSETAARIRRIIANGSELFETRHRRKDGTVFDVEISVSTLDVSGGRFVCFCRDISSRKRDDAALRDSEERYRALFELSNDAAYMVTVDGHFLMVNQAWHDMFGYSAADVAGLNVRDIYVDSAERDEMVIPTLLREGRLVDHEVRFKRIDGSPLDCLISVVARRDDAGAVMYLQGLVRDITQQKRDRRELEESHSELRRLAAHLESVREEERAAVAWELHDEVSQALAVMNSDVETLNLELQGTPSGPARDAVERIRQLMSTTVDHLRRLYSELRPGMLDDLGLGATVEWQSEEFSRRTGIPCVVAQLDQVIVRDTEARLAVYRAFREALDNVARHSGATSVVVRVAGNDGEVTVSVCDNGCGIPLEKVQSPSSLGIGAVREKLRSCGGRLVVRRSEDGGTVVEATVTAG